jgi:4-amino-4-deoxy-L-arabinose transferase-like glycosyltransferase
VERPTLRLDVCAIVALAVAARLFYGLWWRSWSGISDAFYWRIAADLLAGKGMGSITTRDMLVERTPLYPVLLAAALRVGGESALTALVLQVTLGGLIALVAFWIGREIFGVGVGRVSALLVALYPYYVANNTGLSDQALFTLILGIAVLCALRLQRRPSATEAVLTGVALGLGALTRPTAVTFVPLLGLWIVWFVGPGRKAGARAAALMLVGCAVMLAPWLVTTYRHLGRPVLSGHLGFPLWNGNNAMLARCGYPEVSIDYCTGRAYEVMSKEEWARLAALGYVERDDEMAHRAWEFVWNQPAQTLANAAVKLTAAYSWRLNPMYSWRLEPTDPWWRFPVYTVTYGIVLILGVIGSGMSLTRHLPAVVLIALLHVAFAIVFVVFWAHTVHRAPLDLYTMTFASAALIRMFERWRAAGTG